MARGLVAEVELELELELELEGGVPPVVIIFPLNVISFGLLESGVTTKFSITYFSFDSSDSGAEANIVVISNYKREIFKSFSPIIIDLSSITQDYLFLRESLDRLFRLLRVRLKRDPPA